LTKRIDSKQVETTDVEAEPKRLPSPPGGVSRVDTLPPNFISGISRRPHLIGDVIGDRYRLIEALGDGGMGQVFVAENQSMGRRVAVKLLKPDLLLDPLFRKRFQHEATAIAAIEHRNVARFIDLVVGDPTFLVMEFVPGPTLSTVIKQEKRLAPIRAIQIAHRLCWALDAVHRASVIHRDIKPANVILMSDPELGEEPKLIDFGLAKLAFSNEEQLTRAGQFVGTPHYMSPEQIASRDVDARSDVYSLGCLLYHMIAGRPPFGGSDDVQVLYKHMERDPDPLRGIAPDTPPELDLLVRCALAKDPDRRFSSMREMAQALAKLASASDQRTLAATVAPPAPPPVRRWPAVALALTLAVASSGATAWVLTRPKRGLLVVTSLPAGATVEVDGRATKEVTPAALAGLGPGEHHLRLTMPGRKYVERTVRLGADERAAVDVVLPSQSHAVEIGSIPPGAVVFFDGVRVPGETPLSLSIPDDDFHELRLEKLGYEPETQGLKPEDRGPISVSLQQEKQDRGLLWVDSYGVGEVFVDGKDTGYAAPTIGIRVAAGVHKVELRDNTGARGAPSEVTIRAGESMHATIAPPGGSGTR
jgi:hypothetical protein